MTVVADRDQVFTSGGVTHLLYPSLPESAGIGPSAAASGYRIADFGVYGSVTAVMNPTSHLLAGNGRGIWSSDTRTDESSLIGETAPEPPTDTAEQLPAWFRTALDDLVALRMLPSDWDSYGGTPLEEAHAIGAVRFLQSVMSADLQLPDFIPLADGGIQLEWDVGGRQLAFTSESGYLPSVWLTTQAESREVSPEELSDVLNLFRPPPEVGDA